MCQPLLVDHLDDLVVQVAAEPISIPSAGARPNTFASSCALRATTGLTFFIKYDDHLFFVHFNFSLCFRFRFNFCLQLDYCSPQRLVDNIGRGFQKLQSMHSGCWIEDHDSTPRDLQQQYKIEEVSQWT